MNAHTPASALMGERARRVRDVVAAQETLGPRSRRVLLAWLAERFADVGLPLEKEPERGLLLAEHYARLTDDKYFDGFRRVLVRLDLEGIR